jgi:DNA polymerase-3 subunit beta
MIKFTCGRSVLAQAVSTASRAVLNRSSMPVLEGLLLHLSRGVLQITGYDMEIGVRCSIAVESSDEGEFVIAAGTLNDILRKLPEGDVVVEVDQSEVTITSGYSVFNILSLDASSYPPVEMKREGFHFSLQQKTVRSLVQQTVFAVSQSDSKPVHTGCLFHLEGEDLEVVGLDGYRLAIRREKLAVPVEETLEFVVPGKTMLELARILNDSEEEVTIWPTRRSVVVETENIILVTRTIEGEFLNYKNALPKEEMLELRFQVKEFLECLDRTSLLISEKQRSPLRLLFQRDELTLTCITPIGSVTDKLILEYPYETLEIGFNNRFLIDAFKNTEAEEVRVFVKSSLSPMVIQPVEDDHFLFLILPVRLRG